MIILELVPVIFRFLFMAAIIYIIYSIFKPASTRNRDDYNNTYQNGGSYNSSAYRSKTGKYGDKYKTINSHYSNETLNGTGGNQVSQRMASSKDKDQTPYGTDHNHAYEHKVEPIKEATVINTFEDRKEAYRERKKEIKADLHKTSYSKAEESLKAKEYKKTNTDNLLDYGKNGDNSSPIGAYEERIKCNYCGAINIVPRSRSKALKCYFCRQEV